MSRVLLVDDQRFDLHLAQRILKDDPQWSVLTSSSAAAALDLARREPFDVVLTDLVMPEMNGLELLRELRRRWPELPVVIMTSRGSEEIAVEALQAGAASYVNKKHLQRDLPRVLQSVASASLRERQNARLLACLIRGEFAFELPNDHQMILAVIGFLQDATRRLGVVDESEWTRLGIALEEALANAMVHGNLEIASTLRDKNLAAYQKLLSVRMTAHPFCRRRLHVAARLSVSEARFTIRDEGPGFPPGSIPDPTDPENLTRSHGRGLFLIHQFMDAVSFNEAGNEITLVKRRRCPTDAAIGEETVDSEEASARMAGLSAR